MPIRAGSGLNMVGVFEQRHLLHGVCFCGCSLCYGPAAIAKANGRQAWELRPHARDVWLRNRAGLLKIWRQPYRRSGGFKPHPCGKYFPAFGEIVFDAIKLPPIDTAWPDEVKDEYQSVKIYVEAMRQ